MEPIVPTGQQFMHIALMPDVKQDRIFRRIENIMQPDRQFDDAEVRREMAAVLGYGGDQLRTNLIG